MSAQNPIISLKATYYNSATKKWILGAFILNPTHVRFLIEDSISDNLSIPLSSITGIERKQSSLIYPALVITSGPKKYWFASFQNRDTIYNVLELFWKEPLFPNSPSQPKPTNSTLGKELLGILHESETSLIEAASTLSYQGKQLKETEVVLSDLNADLTSAQKILRNMSFLGFLHTMLSFKPKTIETCKDQECRQKHFSVAYTFSQSKSATSSWEAGTLIASSSLTLLDEQLSVKLSFSHDEVKKLLVVSPWEFCLIYSSGDSAIKCHIMCPHLKSVVKFLSSFPSLKNKIVEDINPFYDEESCPVAILDHPSVALSPSVYNSNTEQIQDEESISEQDMDKITSMLNSLQSIATGVSREQQDQMDRINALVRDVDQTELRIKAHNDEIKKKM